MLLDTADETLRRQRCVLRVRNEGHRSLLTFKGPVQPGPMKIREELETVVGDGDLMLQVFERLGLHVWFRYQKYREEFALERRGDRRRRNAGRDVRRGRRQRDTASPPPPQALGKGPADYILDSYHRLFLTYRERLGFRRPRHGLRRPRPRA